MWQCCWHHGVMSGGYSSLAHVLHVEVTPVQAQDSDTLRVLSG